MESIFPPVATGPQSGKREETGIRDDFDILTPLAGSYGEETNGRLNHRKYEQAYAKYRLAPRGLMDRRAGRNCLTMTSDTRTLRLTHKVIRGRGHVHRARRTSRRN